MEENREQNREAVVQASGVPASAKKKSAMARNVAFALTAIVLLGGVGTSVGMNVVLMDEMRAQKEQSAKMSQFIDDERARQAKEAEQESTYRARQRTCDRDAGAEQRMLYAPRCARKQKCRVRGLCDDVPPACKHGGTGCAYGTE